jgi:nucleoside-diphosphate-sugar epimerase
MILVTGANGFVGAALCEQLHASGASVRGAMRVVANTSAFETVVTANLADPFNWTAALKGVEQVVHLAARVHVMKEHSTDPLAAFRCVNVVGTGELARQAAAAGVKRFVFLSSIKVHGEYSAVNTVFTASDIPAPQDPYSQSKLEAEKELRFIGLNTGMDIVVIRAPLVYGSGVKANFSSMLRWISYGVPLPLGAIHNKRSLVSVDNLIDLIVLCLEHPSAAGETLLAADGEDISTTELLNRLGQLMGKKTNLFSVSEKWLMGAATVMGKRGVAQRLCRSLQVDIEATKRVLGWSPPLSLNQGLKKTVEGMYR